MFTDMLDNVVFLVVCLFLFIKFWCFVYYAFVLCSNFCALFILMLDSVVILAICLLKIAIVYAGWLGAWVLGFVEYVKLH